MHLLPTKLLVVRPAAGAMCRLVSSAGSGQELVLVTNRQTCKQCLTMPGDHTILGEGRGLNRSSNIAYMSAARNQVSRVTMNNPAKLNGWTLAMLHRMFAVFDDLAKDADTKVFVHC